MDEKLELEGQAAEPVREEARPIDEEAVGKALKTLAKYKQGKSNLERRVVEDERWYQLRHWDVLRGRSSAGQSAQGQARPEPTSAWLFNSIANKHADAMDNYPEANVLPRESSDSEDAKSLSSILPVILERCGFEEKYSDGWWEKLKHGTAVYTALWNNELENGLGDVDVGTVDLLNIFWEPGVTDIQRSRDLFVVDLRDRDLMERDYPELAGRLGKAPDVDVAQYVYDDTVDVTDKVAVIDWYYKVSTQDGRTLVHYAKLCAGQLLFSSENDPKYAERGWYDHGQYPFVFDTLFPEKGTPVGFGYVALCKDPQMYIDKLSQIMLENAMMSGKKRFFIGANTGVNEDEFLDWNKPLVHVEGASNLDDAHIREIVTSPLDNVFMTILQMKIDEMKETSANRDVSQGSAGAGVTAAAAIAALQEAANKTSRDMIAGSYRSYTQLDYLVLELIRQFYDQTRSFRITGQDEGDYQFLDYSNAGIKDQVVDTDSAGNPLVRRPIFDIKVKAQKKNPFSQMSQNELAKELYAAGIFEPERATGALVCLSMMEFEGKDKIVEQVAQGQTLYAQLQQATQMIEQLTAALGAAKTTPSDRSAVSSPVRGSRTKNEASRQLPRDGEPSYTPTTSGTEMTGYGQQLAAQSRPDMDAGGQEL